MCVSKTLQHFIKQNIYNLARLGIFLPSQWDHRQVKAGLGDITYYDLSLERDGGREGGEPYSFAPFLLLC